MMDTKDSIVNFMKNHEIISCFPVIVLSVMSVIIFIGWFCCTDYYDKYTRLMTKICDESYQLYHLFAIAYIILDLFLILTKGFGDEAHLALNCVMLGATFILIICPFLWNSFFKVHNFFKTKRGKHK